MSEYDGDARPLPWPVRNPLVYSRTTETDPEHDGSVFVWPEDSDERVPIVFNLSLNEFVVLASAVDAGSDIAYGIDAIRVWWLWDRVLRVPMSICDAIINCINTNPATMAAIVNQLIVNTTFNEYLTQTSVADNIYPPRPTAATPDPLCNAATYCVSKLRELISNIYDDLETLDASEVLAGLLGLAGWRSSPLYQLIGLAETNDKTALLAAFDAAAPDLICDLIAEELDQEPILAWIAETYPPPSVLGDAFTYAIQSAADEGKWAQWIAVGATMTEADCNACLSLWCHTIDLTTSTTDIELVYTQDGFPYNTAWTSGIGIEGARPGFLDECIPKLVLPAPAHIDTIAFTTSSVSDATNASAYVFPNGVLITPQALTTGINALNFDVDEDCDFIQFGIDRSGLDRTPIAALTSVTITGTGSNPWGSSNC